MSFTLSLRSVIVSLHYDNLSLLYISSSFRYMGLFFCCANVVFRYVVFYVVMWTNPSIISVNTTPVVNCICRYQSEKPEP